MCLKQTEKKIDKDNSGLYGDDRLAAFNNISKPQAENVKKDIKKIFNELSLKIEIKTNLKTADFLDVTFNLTNGMYYPFKKSNSTPIYTNAKFNHPPTIIKHLTASIGCRNQAYHTMGKSLKRPSRTTRKH